ncbi:MULTISPECIES: hypothetical protein [unclassified Streptomyces]|uniref:Uncharacterized protein n=1 Tax=Streptomyces sp. NBC_00180 TaxID=2903632 RepID=A0AAU1IC45_9ACTN|nr:hypothetical protein OG331_23860 [Streptomyces sp. NBC_01017]
MAGVPAGVRHDRAGAAGRRRASPGSGALIYQHSDEERQRDIAAGLDDLVRAERAKHHKDDRAHRKE